MNRILIQSKDYIEFFQTLNERTKEKIKYCESILISAMPINQKFVKKIVCSDFYELRVSVDNEVRIILFAIDHENINLATKIVLLNGFIKKSNKDYNPNIKKAISILNKIIEDTPNYENEISQDKQ